ncbi:MAG: DNA photolyase family protein [Parvibaculum sp.]|uniref:cryptochrome/photolyase family protein n=1 Tax=Parvibaculum sp. TaxID=2024848 RepID=UPI0025E99328|nr:deoxyribodipyrimidine photo-lyase [Parvibaculum sp.]MCE9649778.1 DNA photolyase family protein [Parvibaculum sp.]
MSVIVWFRRDLRLADNPALSAAVARGEPVIPVYLLDPDVTLGGASQWWLHGSLEALARDLERLGAPLILRRGIAAEVIPALLRETQAGSIHWNRRYEPSAMARDSDLKTKLVAAGVEVRSFNGSLLAEPREVKTAAGGPYKVFTPFWHALLGKEPFAPPLPAPLVMKTVSGLPSDDLASWALRPVTPDWAGGLRAAWRPGEISAARGLAGFLDKNVQSYKEERDKPAIASSRMSPHLHWGEISPRLIWHAADMHAQENPAAASGVAAFRRQLGWREFCAHLLYRWPGIVDHAWKPEYENFAWRNDETSFRLWARGQTGYPIVDAGMRELWRTGWMHNRVRMIAASFLVKDLLIDWRRGADWFEDTLVDADLANNRCGWQWVAGSGADASPFFRIFNPVTQGEKFDPAGDYVRTHVSELGRLDPRFIHRPWEASGAALADAGIVLGENYPMPMVDHAAARLRALGALANMKTQRAER